MSSLQSIKKLRATLWLYLSLIALSLVWLLLAQNGVLTPLEKLSVDLRFKTRGPISAPVRVVYVDIDTDSLMELGNFPWDRGLFAQVCDGLIKQGKAKAIGIDVVFSEGGVPNIADPARVARGQSEFGRYLFGNPPVVLAASYSERYKRKLENGTEVDEQIPLIEGPAGRISPPELPRWKMGPAMFYPPTIGLIDIMDGHTSVAPMFARTPDRTFRHLSLELARLYYGVRSEDVRIEADYVDLLSPDGALVKRLPLTRGQMVTINWFSRWADDERNPRVSFSTVVTALQWLKSANAEERAEGQAFFADDYFKDAIVLIGPTANMLQDLAPTPFDHAPVPKVGVHGNLVKTIVSERFIHEPTFLGMCLITVGLTALVVGLSLASEGKRSTVRRVAAVVVLIGYVVACFVVFSRLDWALPMTAPLGAALSSAFVGGAVQLILAQKQKSRIKGLFGAYLAPSIVSQMVDAGQEPKLGGVEEQITAYFSDVESFSSFSEKLTPPQLVELMNEYLTACTDIVQAEGGTLDKYIGDAVVAIYGAPLALPDHPVKSCIAALRVQRRCAQLREKWKNEPEKNWPEIVLRLRTRIGLNTGRAVVGNMGSASRFSYTMMGDTVNLAARMESGAKSWGVYTMCADPTRVACEAADSEKRIVFRALGRIKVKGRNAPVPIHELVGLKEDVNDKTREAITRFEAGLERFYAQEWDAAEAHFRASAALEPNQPDPATGIVSNPSLVYLKLVAELRAHPPATDWDGVYVMKDK